MATTHLVLEFTEREIRAAVSTAVKGKSSVGELFTVEVPVGESVAPETLGEEGASVPAGPAATALRAALRRRKIRPQRVTVILPKIQATTRRVYLPSSEPAELKRMAQFEAERHIPFHPERHIVSHHVVRNDGIEGSHVYLAAVDGPVIDHVLDVMRGADLTVDVITLSAAASHTALLLAEAETVREKVIALVDIARESTDFSLISKGEFIYTRSVRGGVTSILASASEGAAAAARESLRDMAIGNDYPDAGRAAVLDQFLTRMMTELKRMFEFCRREHDTPTVEEILLVGEGSVVARLDEVIAERVGIPARRVDVGRIAARCTDNHTSEGSLLAHFDSLGAALTPAPDGAMAINLTPQTYREKLKSEKMRQLMIVTGVLAVLTLTLTIVYLTRSLSTLSESVSRYQTAVNELRPAVNEMEDMRTQIRIIRGFVDERNSAMAILDHLSGLGYVPPVGHDEGDPSVRVSFEDFVYDRERGTFELSGYAREIEDLSELRQNLRDTGFFSEVPVPDRTRNPLRQDRPEVWKFTFQCRLMKETPAAPGDNDERPARTSAGPQSFLGGDS